MYRLQLGWFLLRCRIIERGGARGVLLVRIARGQIRIVAVHRHHMLMPRRMLLLLLMVRLLLVVRLLLLLLVVVLRLLMRLMLLTTAGAALHAVVILPWVSMVVMCNCGAGMWWVWRAGVG